MARNRANELRFARIVAERTADGSDGLAQRAVGDDDVAPDAVEDVAPMSRLVAVFDEEDEQIEIARDERLLAPLANEQPAARREDEVAETVARHVRQDGEVNVIVYRARAAATFAPSASLARRYRARRRALRPSPRRSGRQRT